MESRLVRLTNASPAVVTRSGQKDPTGDYDSSTTVTIDGCVLWWESEADNTDQRNMLVRKGTLAVPRGADIKFGDHATWRDSKVRVIGSPEWDMQQPLNGHDFGYMVLAVEEVR